MTPNREIDLNILRQLAGLAAGVIKKPSFNTLGTSSVHPAQASSFIPSQTIDSSIEKWEASFITMKEIQKNLIVAYRDLADRGRA